MPTLPDLPSSIALVVISIFFLWFLTATLGWRLGGLLFVGLYTFLAVTIVGMEALETLVGEKGLLVGFVFVIFALMTGAVGVAAYTRYREKRIMRQLYVTPTNPTGDQRQYLSELTGIAPEQINLSDPEENRFSPSRDIAWRLVYVAVPVGAAFLIGRFFYPDSSWNDTFLLAVLTYFAVAISYGVYMALWYWRFIRSGGVDYIDPNAPTPGEKPRLTLINGSRRDRDGR